MVPPCRKATLVKLTDAKTVGVVLVIQDADFERNLETMDREAREYGFNVEYLLVNSVRKAQIPAWCIKDNMTIITYRVDYDRRCRFRTETASAFISKRFDLLIANPAAISNIVENVVMASQASLKVGRIFAGGGIYDIGVKTETSATDASAQEQADKGSMQVLLDTYKLITANIE